MARIVFDLDGTLIDSAPDLQAVANALLTAEGHAPITLKDAHQFIGDGTPVFVRRMRAARGIADSEQDRLLKAFMEKYLGAVEKTLIYPGVEAALDILAGSHALGLCTNKPLGPTKGVLAHFGLEKYFATVWGGDSLPQHKPDPAPLRAAFAALGDGPQLYVGDSGVDAETAHRAEVPFLLYTEGYRKEPVEALGAAGVFSDWADLPALVDRLLARAA